MAGRMEIIASVLKTVASPRGECRFESYAIRHMLDEIYKAKEARRKVLTNLPIDDKIAIIEKLRDFGLFMREIRKNLKNGQISN